MCSNCQINRVDTGTVLYFLAIFCSLLSNFPPIMDLGLSLPLQLVWVMPFFYLFIFRNTGILWSKELIPFYSFLLFFSLYCLICESVTGKEYLGTDLKNMSISSLITIVSFSYWRKYASETNLERFAYLLLLLGAIFAAYTYFEYLRDTNILSRVYAVKSKNSIGQIIFCCALIPPFLIKNNNMKLRCFVLGVVLLLLVIVFMTKSRATILGVFFIVYYFVFCYSSFKIKLLSMGTLFALATFILLNDDIYNVVINGILLSGREASNLNEISSGRLMLISDCLKGINENFWFGNGNKYMDCMPIIMLFQYGIVGGLMIFSFLIYIGYYVTLRIDRNSYNLIAFLLFWSFMLNSLFEAQPPFGPGVKCFLLWVFIGFALAKPVTDAENYNFLSRN